MTRAIVCGGRDFTDRALVFKELDALGLSEIAQGGARGADRLAAAWAVDRRIPLRTFNAHWDLHGNRAGPIRNARMLDEFRPTLVVAFPGGRGTEDMVTRAMAAGVKVHRVPEGPK